MEITRLTVQLLDVVRLRLVAGKGQNDGIQESLRALVKEKRGVVVPIAFASLVSLNQKLGRTLIPMLEIIPSRQGSNL